jgi:hypothetical protein
MACGATCSLPKEAGADTSRLPLTVEPLLLMSASNEKGTDLFRLSDSRGSIANSMIRPNLTVSRDKKQYIGGTVPSFHRFRSITLNPLYNAAFS